MDWLDIRHALIQTIVPHAIAQKRLMMSIRVVGIASEYMFYAFSTVCCVFHITIKNKDYVYGKW